MDYEGTGDSGTGIAIDDVFDVIKLWHRNKPNRSIVIESDPIIINASWGYSYPASSPSITYRGVTYNSDASFSTSPNTHMRDTYGLYPIYKQWIITFHSLQALILM